MSNVETIQKAGGKQGASQAMMFDQLLLAPIRKAVLAAKIDFDPLIAPLMVPADGGVKVLPLAGYFLLLERISRETGDEALKLTERPLLPGALQLALSQAVLADTLEGAMRNMARSFNLLHGGNYNHVTVRDHCLIYEIDNEGFPYPFALNENELNSLMECILILMHFMFLSVSSDEVEKRLVRVRTRRDLRDAPVFDSQLDFWNVPVSDNAPRYSLQYDYAAAAMPVTMTRRTLPDPNAIYGMVATYITNCTHQVVPRENLQHQVMDLLRRKLATEDEIASQLNMSPRTLRRRLIGLGTSFRGLSDTAKNENAKRLLLQNSAIDAVAEDLGYADARSFRRAFLRWNGVTPNTFLSSRD